jgi:hypothetical protein
VTWDPRRGFRCACPAIGMCAHGHAVASVVLVGEADKRWTDVAAVVV